jgi:hypothetical protein
MMDFPFQVMIFKINFQILVLGNFPTFPPIVLKLKNLIQQFMIITWLLIRNRLEKLILFKCVAQNSDVLCAWFK